MEGRFNGGFFALPDWGAYIWRGLFSEFYGMYLFMYLSKTSSFLNRSPDWFKALGHIHTNPGKKVSVFKNVQGRVDGAKCKSGSRPSDKEEGGGGGEGLRTSVGSKNKRGGRAPPLDPPLNAAIWNTAFMFSMCKVVKKFYELRE